MATPLYVCGLATAGMDKPFHNFEARLKESGQESTIATGRETAEVMLELANEGQQTRPHFKMPYECADVIAAHDPRCAEECGPDCCKHDRQCPADKAMWRMPADQVLKPYAGQMSNRVAKHLIKFYSEDIAKLRENISALLQSHSDAFLKRWKKMTKDKRGRLLSAVSLQRAAAPILGATKSIFRKWDHGHWLNVRDFAKDWMKLVSVLHTRSAYDASSWAQFDMRVGVMGYENNPIPLWFNRSCVVMSGSDYGEIRDFDLEMAHRYASPGFPRAFQTIQAQHELMYTLEDVLIAVVGDSAASGAATWNALVATGLHPAGRDAAWNSYFNQAFTKPVVFSPSLLHQKAQDRLGMIKDELMLMQTDPAYAQEILRTRRINISIISEGLGHKRQTFIGGGFLMLDLFSRFNIWQTIESRCFKLKRLFEHYGESRTGPGQIMPREITLQKSALKQLCNDWFSKASKNFEDFMEVTRAFQRRHNEQFSSAEVDKLDPTQPAGRLNWRIKDLRDNAAKGSPCMQGYDWLFESIEREESMAQIMDKATREHIDDMMLIDEIRTLAQWSQRGKGDEDSPDVEVFSSKTSQYCCVENDPDCHPPHLSFDETWFERTGDLIQDFVDAPWPKGCKDLVWLAKADRSRQCLANLWQGVASEYEKAEQACCHRRSACALHFTEAITAFTTDAGHVAALEQERKLCQAESARLAIIAEEDAIRMQEHIVQSEWGSTEVATPVCRKTTKSEAKLPITQIEHKLEEVNLKPEVEEVSPDPIPIKKESLAVFHKMYRAGTEYTSNGTIRWTLFVQAMQDAGFSAEEASGSAVSFRDATGKTICFHRPHPDPVLDHIMLYGMAKRMKKWFGFSSESFVLKE